MQAIGELVFWIFTLYMVGALAHTADFEKMAIKRIKLGLVSLEATTPVSRPAKFKNNQKTKGKNESKDK